MTWLLLNPRKLFSVCQYFFEKKKQKKNKKKTEHFSKYINFKIEMNPCSGKTAKLKDLFLIERDTVALMPSYINLNFLTSFEV